MPEAMVSFREILSRNLITGTEEEPEMFLHSLRKLSATRLPFCWSGMMTAGWV